MKCPKCGRDGFTVADSRPSKYGPRRRRVCHGCGFTMKTVEIPENEMRSVYAFRKQCLLIVKEAFGKIKNMTEEQVTGK